MDKSASTIRCLRQWQDGSLLYCRHMGTPGEIIESVRGRMRMSHIYQPLLIRALVGAGGAATMQQLSTPKPRVLRRVARRASRAGLPRLSPGR